MDEWINSGPWSGLYGGDGTSFSIVDAALNFLTCWVFGVLAGRLVNLERNYSPFQVCFYGCVHWTLSNTPELYLVKVVKLQDSASIQMCSQSNLASIQFLN